MLAGYTTEDDGKTWKLTLRDGLTFPRRHQGPAPARGRQYLSRWGVVDAFGQALFVPNRRALRSLRQSGPVPSETTLPLLPQALAETRPPNGRGDAGTAGA